ncbi:LYS9 [Candida oxycetoniae]|uniref:Saccharopine dehydrogenase [NADP(+), L-glutamate-forming] n=1 Tax=Candida oxycetoniae TaxID=497107 RepID=A0AAI9WWB0_9ASCO|nr:LYS9 [Candida oxycetoniae]KAI3402842.2 LYS9 [Candida oxycetoniae]
MDTPGIALKKNSSIALPYLYSVDQKCRSCGVKLQDEDKDKPGYFIKPSAHLVHAKLPKRHEDIVFDRHLQSLSKENQELLINNFNVKKGSFLPTDSQNETPREILQNIYTVKSDKDSMDCIRCRNITFQTSFKMNHEQFPINELHQVVSQIPKSAPLVYLFSALDFPMGINPEIFKFRNPKDIYFIMTKTDNLVEKRNTAGQKYARTFLSDYLEREYGVPFENIFIASSKESWNVSELYRFIPNGSFVIGNINCGKSSAIKSLMLDEELSNKKEQAREVACKLLYKQKQRFVDSFNKKIGPGISFLPGFTRDIIPVNIGLKTVYDVPGFSSNSQIHQLFKSFKSPKDIHRLIECNKAYKKGTYNSRYESFKGPQVLSFGGLAYLQLPMNAMYQIRNVTNFNIHQFSNIAKVREIAENIPVSLENKFVVSNHSIDKQFNSFLVPPFYGSIDLVFENFGYVNIKPTGAKQTNELMKLYLYPGMQAIIRQPISNYVAKTFSGYDKNGNPLRKENIFKKSTFRLIRYSGKQPLFSKLIPSFYNESGFAATGESDRDKAIRNQEYLQLNSYVNPRNYYSDTFEMSEGNKRPVHNDTNNSSISTTSNAVTATTATTANNRNTTASKKKARPLSTSISAINLKLPSSKSNTSSKNLDKENIEVKTRASFPDLKSKPVRSYIPTTTTTNNNTSEEISPVTVNSQFDLNNMSDIDSVSLHTCDSLTKAALPFPSSPKRLRRTTNLYNLSDFIKQISIDNEISGGDEKLPIVNRKSIQWENEEIRKLNEKLQSNEESVLSSEIRLIENVMFLTTSWSKSSNECDALKDFKMALQDTDFVHLLQNEEYHSEDGFCKIDADQMMGTYLNMVKKVLLLGSGFVAKPTVDILSSDPNIEVTVACRTLSKAKALAADKAKAISLDVTDAEALDKELANFDLVISLIPYTHHVNVVKSAIKNKKHVVTTSYINPQLKALEKEIEEAGITVMNEIGLDPGIDHLYAVKTIEEVHKDGGKIKSFLSYCGGLPAPENSDNPLGYKFSWSSRGVLLALRNSARYWQSGKVVDVKSEDLMASAKPYFIYPGFALVCYPNRDSTTYKELYNIPEAETVIRGTLRFQGFPEFVKVLVDTGFLKDEETEIFTREGPWNEATAKLIGAKSSDQEDLISRIKELTTFKSKEDEERIIDGFKWLGLLSDNKTLKPKGNPLDSLCATLEELMQYEEGERDLVILQHKFGIENKDGSQETRTSTLVDYGDPKGYSSMAKLVGVPCAVAVKQILNGTLSKRGLLAPMTSEINDPIMKELKDDYGIYLVEKTV